MNINIKTKGGLTVTDDLRAYIDEKISQLLKYLQNEDNDAIFFEVELQEVEEEQGRRYRVDITVNAPGKRIHAVGWGEHLHAALDEAKDELSRRVRREKKKERVLLKKMGRKIKDILRFGKAN